MLLHFYIYFFGMVYPPIFVSSLILNTYNMKTATTKLEMLKQVVTILTLEQMNSLPFGDDHDSRYEARKKIIEALEILETINENN